MESIVSNNITISEPSTELLEYCKKNLIFSNPTYSKQKRLGFKCWNIPKNIVLYSVDNSKLILPYGTQDDIESLLKVGDIKYDFKLQQEVDYKTSIPLRDYQSKAIDELVKKQRGILKAHAGSGKTQIGIALIVALKKKTLWITHTHDLLNQSMQRARQYIDDSLIGTITEGKVNIGSGVTFSTIQTLSNINLLLYQNTFDLIIVDECHRVSGSDTQITQFSKVLNVLNAKHKYGLSATMHRNDGLIKTTYALLGNIAYEINDSDVEKYLQQASIYVRDTKIKGSRDMLNTDGTLNYSKLITYLTENKPRNTFIINDLTFGMLDSNLILSSRTNHLKTLINELPKYLKDLSVYIDGKTKKEIREKSLDDIRNGTKKYLFATYKLAKEGLDIPILNKLYLTTPEKDYAIIIQAIGRIQRKHENKNKSIVFDYIDNIIFCQKAFKARCRIYKKNNIDFNK